MSLSNPGGRLRDVETSSPHVLYRRNAETLLLEPTEPQPTTQWTISGKLGTFVVDGKAAGQEDPTFDITYTPKFRRFTRRYSVQRAAFMRFIRTGDNDDIDRDANTLFPQSYLRTDPYSGYRIDRIYYRTPFSGQRTPLADNDSFMLAQGRFIQVQSSRNDAFESYRGELFQRMRSQGKLFFRFEAITALVDYITGEIFEAVEWGTHMERNDPDDFGTCTVYAPSLLSSNMESENKSLLNAAIERELGMILAMARWNNDYALLVERLFDEPRFAFLAKLPSLGFITSWHGNIDKRIKKIPGEQEQWKYTPDQRIDISPPSDGTGTVTVSPFQRPLAVYPLQAPSPPPNPPVKIGTAYTLGVATVLAELRRLRVNPRAISGVDDPLWLAAQVSLELAGKKRVKDWTIVEEMLDSLNEKFKTAAKAARRKLDPPPPGYLERGLRWMEEHFPDANLPDLGQEDEVLSSVEKDDIVREILRDNNLQGSPDVAEVLRTQGVRAVIDVCNKLWHVYMIELGPPASIRLYSPTFDSAPKWFGDLQAYMPHFYRFSTEMMDPSDDLDGTQTDPLFSPEPRGFVNNQIGFLVDGRSLEVLKTAKAIVPAITYPVPSFNMAKEARDEAERIHPRWAFETHIAEGSAFYWRDTMELDYQTAVVVTRSPAGLFRFVNGSGYLYAVAVPESGVDLEAAQHYFAEVLQDASKISRVGEKAYSKISYEDLLARVVIETARKEKSQYPEFYRYVGDWGFTRFAQNKAQKDYIKTALAPPFLPVPLCCYREYSQTFVDVRFEDNPVHLEGIVGVPIHVWNDFQVVYQRQNVNPNEQQQLNDNELLAIDVEFSEDKQVQESTQLMAEKQRQEFVEMVEQAAADVTRVERLEQLVRYPAWFLNADLLRKLLDEVEKVKRERGEISHADLVKHWHSVLGPRVQIQPFDVTPPFINFKRDVSLEGLRQYFQKIRLMMDPDEEELIQTYVEDSQVVRWPVSPQPRGFVQKLIGFVVAFPAAFKDTVEKNERKKKLFPDFSKSGQLSSVWKDIGLQDRDFVFNRRGSSLIPESCIFISRTVEGALMTAKPNNDPNYGLDPGTAQRVYAIRLDGNMTGFDLEKFQKDQITVKHRELEWDALPGVKALSLQSELEETDILASIPIRRLDIPPLNEFASVDTFGQGIENPRELPVLFHFRPLKPQWEYVKENNASEDEKVYLEKAFPKVWFPSFTEVDGRVHVKPEAPVAEDGAAAPRRVTMEDIAKATAEVNENPRFITIGGTAPRDVAPNPQVNPVSEYASLAKLTVTATGLRVRATSSLQEPENADQANAVWVPPVPNTATLGFRSDRAPNVRFAVSNGFSGCYVQVWRTPNNELVFGHGYKGAESNVSEQMAAYAAERDWTNVTEIDTSGLVIPEGIDTTVGVPFGIVIVDLIEDVVNPLLMLFRVNESEGGDVVVKVLKNTLEER